MGRIQIISKLYTVLRKKLWEIATQNLGGNEKESSVRLEESTRTNQLAGDSYGLYQFYHFNSSVSFYHRLFTYPMPS